MEEEDYDYDNYGEQEYQYEQDYDYNDYNNAESHPASSDSGKYHQQPYEILPLEKIFQQLSAMLDQVKMLVCLDRGWCLLLLKQFKWDKDILREEVFNNYQKYMDKIGMREGLLSPGQCSQVKDMCMVCCAEDAIVVENVCRHAFCLECWLGGLRASIIGGHPFVKCMDDTCGAPVLLERVEAILTLGNQQVLRRAYLKKLCEMMIISHKRYQFCTGADCSNCIKLNDQSLLSVRCACGKIFCFRCMSDDHYPCKCEQKSEWTRQVLAEEADAKWISANAKVCPWCKKAVERSMGCNFMACTCGKNFCYMCSRPWQPDHKDHFKCHIYKKKPDQVVTREKEIMEKMNHCTERFVFNQAVANNYKAIDVFAKRKYLFHVLNIDLTESEFMETAYKFAIECCEKLKWIYAFTYFTALGARKDAFDFSLGEYEKYKENLLKLLAVDLKRFVQQIQKAQKEKTLQNQGYVWDLRDRFKAMKKTIVNLYTCTKNYKDKFVEEMAQITTALDLEKETEELKQYMPGKVRSEDKREEKKGFFEVLGLGKTKSKGKKAGK